jgi:hypothetical protein
VVVTVGLTSTVGLAVAAGVRLGVGTAVGSVAVAVLVGEGAPFPAVT